MRTLLFRSTLACGLMFAAAPAFAQGACQRADLQKVADGYVAAQNEGNQFKIPLTQWVQYTENLEVEQIHLRFLGELAKFDDNPNIDLGKVEFRQGLSV